MRIKKLQLKDFKRFNDLTIDLENHSKKIIALVGPNGSGKSSVFDGFEQFSTNEREKRARMGYQKNISYLKKSIFQLIGISPENDDYDSSNHVLVESDQTVYTSTSFYIRSAHRFTPRIEIKQIRALSKIEEDEKRPKYLIDIDSRLEENYERLIGGFFSEVYDKDITGKQWSEKNIQNLNKSLNGILDISIVSLGNPTHEEGSLYFTKGTSSKFPYENLSAGEKEVVDLILDLYIKRDFYSNTLICIDEPELHLSTSIQRKLLVEIEKIIPDTCQLWVATHSIGFLRALQEDLKDKTAVIDFLGNNFDEIVVLKPIPGTRKDWIRIFETALEDLTGLLAPKKIIYCEGKKEPGDVVIEDGLDAIIYNSIFNKKYPDTLFISSGGGSEPRQYSEVAIKILQKSFLETEILILKDRGGKEKNLADTERDEQLATNHNKRILVRREIENYIFDPEILLKYNPDLDISIIYPEEFDYKNEYLKPKYQVIKTNLKFSGNNKEMMTELAKFITEDTEIYKEMKSIIFTETT